MANQETPLDVPAGNQTAVEPVKKRRRFSRGFWIAVGVILLLIAVLWVPNYLACGPGARPVAQRNACIANLKQIDGAVQQWALENHKAGTNAVTISDVLSYLKGSTLPTCPLHGVYSVSTVSATPTCTQSAKGHSL